MRPPLLMTVSIHHPGRHLRLWLPLFLIWILLLPLCLLLLPLVLIVALAVGHQPLRAIAGLLGVLGSLSGTCIDVARPDKLVFVRIV
jgi:hypothetical protein